MPAFTDLGEAKDNVMECREERSRDSVGLLGAQVACRFDAETGALISLKNQVTGDEMLKKPEGEGNPFRVWLNPTERPPALGLAWPYPIQPPEGTLGGTIIEPRECRLKSSKFRREGDGGELDLVLQHLPSSLTFQMNARLPDKDVALEMRLTVVNSGDRSQKLLVAMPYLTGLGLGQDPSTNLGVRLREFGQAQAPAWSLQGGVYGRDWGGQWNAVYEPSLNEGLGLIVQDPKILNKMIRRFPPSGMSVLYFNLTELGPGQSAEFPTTQILVHTGDWKVIARRYANWFESSFPLRKTPAWVDQMDLFVGSWIPSPDAVIQAQSHPETPGAFRSFRDLPLLYLQDTYDLKEWAQYWQSVVDTGRYDAYDHTDGVYEVRRDLGGAQALAEGNARLRQDGRVLGLYMASKTVRKDSILFRNSPMEDWLLMDTPDKKIPPEALSLWVCGGYEPWQDHLARTCQRLLRETGARYIRLDEMGHPFEPCFNQAHHHPDPYGAMTWNLELLRKVRSAMDEVDPEALLFTEGAFELLHLQTNGALCLWSPGIDLAPLRLTAPDYLCFSYHSGQIESALNGFVCGRTLACNGEGWFTEHHNKIWGAGLEKKPPCYLAAAPDGQPKNEMQWHVLGHTFMAAMRHGDPLDQSPLAPSQDPQDWAGRIWRSPQYWIMLAGNRAGMRPSVPVSVELPEVPQGCTRAYEFDLATLERRETPITGRSGPVAQAGCPRPQGDPETDSRPSVELKAGFSCVFLPLPECPPLVESAPEALVLGPGGSLEIELKAFEPWSPAPETRRVSLSVSGLEVSSEEANLPARIRVSAPNDVEPGLYPIMVQGDVLPLKRWIRVESKATG